jgi:hypothetical protein
MRNNSKRRQTFVNTNNVVNKTQAEAQAGLRRVLYSGRVHAGDSVVTELRCESVLCQLRSRRTDSACNCYCLCSCAIAARCFPCSPQKQQAVYLYIRIAYIEVPSEAPTHMLNQNRVLIAAAIATQSNGAALVAGSGSW